MPVLRPRRIVPDPQHLKTSQEAAGADLPAQKWTGNVRSAWMALEMSRAAKLPPQRLPLEFGGFTAKRRRASGAVTGRNAPCVAVDIAILSANFRPINQQKELHHGREPEFPRSPSH